MNFCTIKFFKLWLLFLIPSALQGMYKQGIEQKQILYFKAELMNGMKKINTDQVDKALQYMKRNKVDIPAFLKNQEIIFDYIKHIDSQLWEMYKKSEYDKIKKMVEIFEKILAHGISLEMRKNYDSDGCTINLLRNGDTPLSQLMSNFRILKKLSQDVHYEFYRNAMECFIHLFLRYGARTDHMTDGYSEFQEKSLHQILKEYNEFERILIPYDAIHHKTFLLDNFPGMFNNLEQEKEEILNYAVMVNYHAVVRNIITTKHINYELITNKYLPRAKHFSSKKSAQILRAHQRLLHVLWFNLQDILPVELIEFIAQYSHPDTYEYKSGILTPCPQASWWKGLLLCSV